MVPAFGGLETLRSQCGSSSPSNRHSGFLGAWRNKWAAHFLHLAFAATEEAILLVTTLGWIRPPEFLELSIVSTTVSRDTRNLKVTLLRDVCFLGRIPAALRLAQQ